MIEDDNGTMFVFLHRVLGENYCLYIKILQQNLENLLSISVVGEIRGIKLTNQTVSNQN